MLALRFEEPLAGGLGHRGLELLVGGASGPHSGRGPLQALPFAQSWVPLRLVGVSHLFGAAMNCLGRKTKVER